VWREQISALATRFDCRVMDYGSLDSVEAMAGRTLAGAPDRFLLAGHSMGGRVALELVRRAPQGVTGLALLDTGYQPRASGEHGQREAEQRHQLVALANEQGMRAMGREWLRLMLPEARWNDAPLVDAMLAMVERKSPQILAAQIRALLARPDASEVLPGITCPTLLLCGREDRWSPLARHEQMARVIPGARLEVIEAAGHMTTMERPASVSTAMHDFLCALG